MKTMNKQAIKANSPKAEIDIISAKKKELMANLDTKPAEKKQKRKIGILNGKVKIKLRSDFKMTEDEFLRL